MNADPVQLLDRLTPPDGWSAAIDLDLDPVAAQILDRVLGDAGNVIPLDSARRRRSGVAAAGAITAIVTGGAVAAIWNRSPEQTQRVACWSDPADPPVELLSLKWDGVTDPTTLCSAEWERGTFETASRPEDLTACVTAERSVAVVPGDPGLCEALGFTEFVPPLDEDRVRAVNDAAAELDRTFFASTNCVPLADAEGEIRRVLDSYGLSGWDIQVVGTFSANEPCATVSLDPAATAAVVAPAPRAD